MVLFAGACAVWCNLEGKSSAMRGHFYQPLCNGYIWGGAKITETICGKFAYFIAFCVELPQKVYICTEKRMNLFFFSQNPLDYYIHLFASALILKKKFNKL
jgi:hypothetical protein